MVSEFHPVEGPWKGKLIVSPRPRGDQWLAEDMLEWQKANVDLILSLLTRSEEQNLGLFDEAKHAHNQGIKFLSLPIPDFGVPRSLSRISPILDQLSEALARGNKVVIHCRQGIGRTGMVASCLLVNSGIEAYEAIQRVTVARGLEISQTPEQKLWVERYANRRLESKLRKSIATT